MSIVSLDIEDSLKTRLEFLLNEFESYRISNPIEETKVVEKKSSLLKKIFFSAF